jgi:hypothetical protein
VQYLNAILTRIFDFLLAWAPGVSPFWVLFIISGVFGVLMLVVFRHTSNQDAIRRVRDTITAELLAAKLFKDDIRVTLRAQGQLFVQSFRLLICMLRPLAVAIVPMLLILVQFGVRYEYRPVRPGESLIVSAEVANIVDLGKFTTPPEPSAGLRVETPALRIRKPTCVEWRVRALADGDQQLRIDAGKQRITVPVKVSDKLERIAWRIPGKGFWDQLFHPGVPPIGGDGPIIGVDVRYPVRSTLVLGMDIHWVITFFILSTIIALIFKPIIKVNL